MTARVFGALLYLSLTLAPGRAQIMNGSIAGTVADPSGEGDFFFSNVGTTGQFNAATGAQTNAAFGRISAARMTF